MAIIRTAKVDLKVNGEGAQAYVAMPDDDAAHPGVVLIQEWWGIEPHIKDLAQKLAVAGFVTVVPDLYHGKVATEPDDAQKLSMALSGSMAQAVAEIRGAVSVLQEWQNVQPKKFGIIGFCMGGLLTYKAIEQIPELVAACAFYGVYYNDPQPATVNASVMAVFGSQDAYTPPEYIQSISDAYRNAGKDMETLVYDAGHAFINPTHGSGNEEAARDAWPRAIAHLKKHLAE